MTQYANYIITAIGLLGFYLAGKKVWWCWYINIANQILWLVYGIATEQWGFVVGTFFYTFVFIKNAISWTKEHRAPKVKWDNKTIGRITDSYITDEGFFVDGQVDLDTPEGRDVWKKMNSGTIGAFSMKQPNTPEATFVPVEPSKFKRWWINTPRRNGLSETAAKHARELREVFYTNHDKDLRDLVPDFKTTKPLTFANKVTVRREDLESSKPSLIDTLQMCPAYILTDKMVNCQKTVGEHQPDPNRGGLFTDHARRFHRARIEHPEYGEFGGYQIITWEGFRFDTQEVAYTEEQK